MKALPVIVSSLVAALVMPVAAYAACSGTICITNYNVPNAKLLNAKNSLGGTQCPKGIDLIYNYNNEDQTMQTFTTSPSTKDPACTQNMVWKIPDTRWKHCFGKSREQIHAATPLSSNASSSTEIELSYSAKFSLIAELSSDTKPEGGKQETCDVVSQKVGPLTFTGCNVIFGGTQIQCTWEKQ